jgi:anti-sigma B factor antagonist
LTDRGNIAGDGLRKHPVLGVDTVDAARVVRLGGELDLYNAAQVRAALDEACAETPERVVVDLAEVVFIDSTVLGVLIETRAKLDNRGGLLLAAPGLETRRALQISGLDKLFTVHDTVPDALSAKV